MLTKAEIQIMNILWDMPEGGCVHDIIEGTKNRNRLIPPLPLS